MKTHKFKRNSAAWGLGAWTYCLYILEKEKTTRLWKKVTCKKCLKLKAD